MSYESIDTLLKIKTIPIAERGDYIWSRMSADSITIATLAALGNNDLNSESSVDMITTAINGIKLKNDLGYKFKTAICKAYVGWCIINNNDICDEFFLRWSTSLNTDTLNDLLCGYKDYTKCPFKRTKQFLYFLSRCKSLAVWVLH